MKHIKFLAMDHPIQDNDKHTHVEKISDKGFLCVINAQLACTAVPSGHLWFLRPELSLAQLWNYINVICTEKELKQCGHISN